MGRTAIYDWAKAKDLYDRGVSLSDIAKTIGCTLFTAQQRSSKKKWGEQKILARAGERSNLSVDWLKEQSNEWLTEANRLLQRTTRAANKLGDPKTRAELRTDAEVCKMLIAAGREHYGLDKGSGTLKLGVSIGGSGLKLALVANGNAQLVVNQHQLTEGESDTHGERGQTKETPPATSQTDAPGAAPLSAPSISIDAPQNIVLPSDVLANGSCQAGQVIDEGGEAAVDSGSVNDVLVNDSDVSRL